MYTHIGPVLGVGQGCGRWIFQNMDYLGFIGLAQIHVFVRWIFWSFPATS